MQAKILDESEHPNGARESVGGPPRKHGKLVGLLCGVVFIAATMECRGAAEDSPYRVILKRNPFGLRPIPQPAATPLPQLAPVEVYLTGMYRLGEHKRVLLKIVDKIGGQKVDLSPPLRDGGVYGRIQVVAIQIEKRAVVVRIDGQEQTLSFEKIAPKITPSSPPRVVSTPTATATQRFFVLPPASQRSYR